MDTIQDEQVDEISPTRKYVSIGIVIVLILIGVGALLSKASIGQQHQTVLSSKTTQASSPFPRIGQKKARGKFSMKGKQFSQTPLFSHAYVIYPGTLSSDAKKALNGWNLQAKQVSSSETQVTIAPLQSEPEDHTQQFLVKPGDTLYFVELNLSDDQTPGTDENHADDVGVLVDQNGIVQ